MRKIITSYLLFFSFLSVCSAQKDNLAFNTMNSIESSDSNTVAPPKVLKQKSPLKASLLSTFIPGTGQVYNGKYWKAPIVWGGFARLIWVYDFYSKKHNFYNQILIYKDRGGADQPLIDYVEETNNEFSQFSGNEIAAMTIGTVSGYSEDIRKRKQQVIIGSAVFYIFQIVDASVDAHFSTFDVSDDLTLNIQPAIFPNSFNANGIKLSFNF
jgi:hypothetical protein|tara:strand:- start:489 stop:1124 length:636 start_codon:yes stop_codon:yes gene_type:complete